MIPCCCKSFWRDVEGVEARAVHARKINSDGRDGSEEVLGGSNIRHFLYLGLVFWVGFVLWRIDIERQAATMYRTGGDLEATTSIWQNVAKSIKSGLGSTLEAHMERAKAHIMISYVVIPGSVLIMLYIVYRMITTDELVSDKEGSCPLGYTNENLPTLDAMKQAEAARVCVHIVC
mmetsp:Transcript_36182/g.61164  ORF Transcript_36182/g.61164 Transcript_36182/m.61164 type:complete len:176 (+) Transcript_36182:254-781(+)